MVCKQTQERIVSILPNTAQNIRIGYGYTSQYLSAYVMCVLAYTRKLTIAEVNELDDYFEDQYGITLGTANTTTSTSTSTTAPTTTTAAPTTTTAAPTTTTAAPTTTTAAPTTTTAAPTTTTAGTNYYVNEYFYVH